MGGSTAELRRASWRGRTVLALVAVGGAMTLGACTGTPAGGATAPTTAPAASRTAASTSATPAPGPVDAEAFLGGLLEKVEGQDSVNVVVDSDYEFLNADLLLSTGAQRVLLRDAEQSLNVVVIDDVVWTQDEEPLGSPWTEVDERPEGLEAAGPSHHVRAWQDGVRSVTRGRTEVVEGHTLTTYAVAVRADAAWAALGMVTQPGSPGTVTYIVRVDEDGLLRDANATMGDSRVTITYDGWGAPLEIVAPPRD
ncbi:hypothetical protein LG324_02445 [Phycicoccus jejuensis]|uniref:hypothetical protein n=1 Tax=Phycicoccus jejuensis TaxID=367299 RepID=UPI00384B7F38